MPCIILGAETRESKEAWPADDMTNAQRIIKQLKDLADPNAVEGMERYGIKGDRALGVSIPKLRKLAKETGRDHTLALGLWSSGIHEARILAGMVDDPGAVTESQMEEWVSEFDSWDICDQVCMNLFWLTPFAYPKCYEWSAREEEFVKRAAFALMARLAWSDRGASDERIAEFLPIIKREATDGRNFVKKAVNWALRQVGKRNSALNSLAIQTAEEILELDSKAARWVATNALKELQSDAVQRRLSRAG
jgi:3-methyladenine DNA glycosylase AlkD